MEKEYRRKSKVDGFLVVGFILLVIYSISFLTPLLWSLLTSFKEEIDFMNNKISFPKSIDFQNYFTAFKNIKVPIVENGIPYQINSIEMLYNSLVYTVLCTFTHTLVPCLTAYAVAKMEVKFGKVIYSIVIITTILPIIGNLARNPSIKALGFLITCSIGNHERTFLGNKFLDISCVLKSTL